MRGERAQRPHATKAERRVGRELAVSRQAFERLDLRHVGRLVRVNDEPAPVVRAYDREDVRARAVEIKSLRVEPFGAREVDEGACSLAAAALAVAQSVGRGVTQER